MLPFHWLVVLVGLSGLGSVIVPNTRGSVDGLFDAFWCGALLASTVLQAIHLVLPVSGSFAPALIVLGLAAGFRDGGALYRVSVRPWVIGFLALFALWATMASMHEPPMWDFGLYHLPAVRWAQAYAAVPGLANLHWPLGHTSSFFTFTAAFDDRGVTWVQSFHVIPGLFVLVLAAEGLTALIDRQASALTPSRVFRAFGIVFAAMLISDWLPTLSPDVAVAVVGYVTASRFAAFMLEDPSAQTPHAIRVILLLVGLGITLKLTGVVYFGVIALVTLWVAPPALRTRRTLMPAALLIGISIAVWCATSVVLSGYPFYPAAVLPVPSSWTVPATTVHAHAVETLWHTRGVGLAPVPHWIAHWMRDIVWRAGKVQVLLPLGLGAVSLAVALVRGRPARSVRAALFLLPAVIGATVWVFTAPEPRFSGAIFWHAGIGLVSLVVSDLATQRAGTARLVVLSGAPALIALYLVAGSRARDVRPPWEVPAVAQSPPFTRVSRPGGLVVNVPIADDRCLDTPIPCAPNPPSTLALRRAGDLAAGFRVRSSQ